MKIMICDDSAEDLAVIGALLAKYRDSHDNIRFETEQFADSAELYRSIQAGRQGDIYILDIIMSQKTGLDIARLIRSTDERSTIIYTTSSDDFALEAYGVHAVRYLLKPVREEAFFEALDCAVSFTQAKAGARYPVKTKEGPVSVPYSRIEYIENCSRTLSICLTDGKSIKSIFIRKSFDEEIRQITEDRSFLQVHKSFVVNLNYVDRLAQGNLIMANGKSIPVSKTRAAEVKREYLMFVSEQYR